MSENRIPQYDTQLMTDVWESVNDFCYDYQHVGIPTTISVNPSAMTLYYLLYARYGNNPIANRDVNQFKYKIFSTIFQYGPTWEKRLDIQKALREMQLSDLIDDGGLSEATSNTGSGSVVKSDSDNKTRTYQEAGTNTGTVSVGSTATSTGQKAGTVETDNSVEDIKNHAYNPNTVPATNAYTPLGYINEQSANKNVLDGNVSQTESTNSDSNSSSLTTNNLADAKSGTITDLGTVSSTVSTQDLSSGTKTTLMTAGKLKAYERLIELLEADCTGEFISKFKNCFKTFVSPEFRALYVSEEE